MSEIAARLAAIKERIAAAAKAAGAIPAVTLVAVSKTQCPRRGARACGRQRVFGENRVQEAAASGRRCGRNLPIELHLIGPLQTNKASEAVALFDVIETSTGRSWPRCWPRRWRSSRGRPPVCQVNTGEEPQKAGVLPSADDFIAPAATSWICRSSA